MSRDSLRLKPQVGEGWVTPGARMLVVLDVDSTLIEEEVIELVAQYVGVEAKVAEVTERAMRGELDFAESLRERVSLLAGVSAAQLREVAARVTPTTGATTLIEGVHAAGGRVAAVSGGFHEVLDPLADQLGLDLWRANRFEIVDGRLTGRVMGEIIGQREKRFSLGSWAHSLDVPLSRSVAIGDGANDLGMMDVAGLSIAFDAKPIVREHASVVMRDRDLSQVLAALGLRG